jgi:electron transfer flavoprotein alpha subunit
MSVLIYAESADGKIKKGALELAAYASELAKMMQTDAIAVTINQDDVQELGQYGISKVLKAKHDNLNTFSAKAYAEVIKQAQAQGNASVVIIASTIDSLYVGSILSAGLNAGMASNVVALPESLTPFRVKRTAFSNKAFNVSEISTEIKLLAIAKNSYGVKENPTSLSEVALNLNLSDDLFNVKVVKQEKASGKVTIADADVVVSAGRGLKGPENWGMIEELADVLGAATACSKPVSDLGWRSHGEHVGQTGKPVATNLYIAIGISGAIQHIAGVNSSKVKVVINTDAEAPFFKVADYGIVGDAFDVVPKLIEKLKAFKAANA